MAPFNNNPGNGMYPGGQMGYDPTYGQPRRPNNADIYRQQQANLASLGNNQPMQSLQQNVQPSYMPGRIVSGVDEIKVNEVPMDGSLALFPQNDLSCIYAKQWSSDGTINTVRYILDIPAPSAKQSTTITDEVATAIMERLDKIEKALKPKKQWNNNKGKVDKNA